MADFKIEREVLKQGFHSVAGLDEAGRGALFGPVVAASVVFSSSIINGRRERWISEIDDSKSLPPKVREKLARGILYSAHAVGLGMASHSEIDRKNIYRATFSAMRNAIKNMQKKPDFLLVDGFNLNNVNYPQKRITKGDTKSISIAAASIIAKVFRDELMKRMDRIFEGYSLSRNKGYGTKAHYEALERLGPSSFHRMTFNLKTKR